MNSQIIYLDNNATTPLDKRVMDAMLPYMLADFGNAHSRDHAFGDEAAKVVESAREDVASLIGTDSESVIFTSGSTESVNIAIEGFCIRMHNLGRHARIALPPTEHVAVIGTCSEMKRRGLAEIDWISVDSNGNIDLSNIESLCRDGVDLVCVMGANNEIGNIYPIESIGEITSEHGVFFFCDGSQSIGKVPFNFDNSQADFLTISAHKIYGPKGVGALVIRKINSVVPTRYGGAQEKGLRPGTLNVPGIVGLGVACRLRQSEMKEDEMRIRIMRDKLQKLLSEKISDMKVNGSLNNRLAGNLHISVKGIFNIGVIAQIRNRLAISTGAACSSGAETPSHVLRAICLSDEWINGSIRIGIGKFNNEMEMYEASNLLYQAIERLRSMETMMGNK